jgi:hypothetical protein
MKNKQKECHQTFFDFWQQKNLTWTCQTVTKVIANSRKDGPPATTYGTAKPSATSPEVFSPLW